MRPIINPAQTIRYELDITEDSRWISVSPCEMARDSFLHLQEAGHFRAGPRYFTEREGLQSYLVKCTLSGRGRLEYRGRTYDLGSGDVFFIRCDEHQRYGTVGAGWEQVWLHFSGPGAQGYFDRFWEAGGGSCVVHLPRTDELREDVEKLFGLYRLGGMHADIMAAPVILDALSRLMIAVTGAGPGAAPLPRHVQEAIDLMQAGYGGKITLEYLAGQVALNKQYLQKLFKRHTGMSPYTYLTSIRIGRAKELLQFTNRPVEEVAALVGMESPSHFGKTFKDLTGMTPNAYRRMWSAR